MVSFDDIYSTDMTKIRLELCIGVDGENYNNHVVVLFLLQNNKVSMYWNIIRIFILRTYFLEEVTAAGIQMCAKTISS